MPDYILKTVDSHGRAYGGFRWPLEPGAEVVATDWDATPTCGGGLHGALNGEGRGELFFWASDAVWIVAEVPDGETVIDLMGKVKVRRCVVRFAGDREGATAWLAEKHPGLAIIGGTATAGYDGTATAGYHGTAAAGDRGTATAGDGGTATAGYDGTATAGDRGTATAGDRGTATAGDGGTATAGYDGTATAGYDGIATAGDRGTATAGDYGTATAGDRGTATAGDGGTANAGNRGIATAGDWGEIRIRYYDGDRHRLAVGYVGEGGIKPNVAYVVNDGRLVAMPEGA